LEADDRTIMRAGGPNPGEDIAAESSEPDKEGGGGPSTTEKRLGGATTGNRLRTALARDLESRGVDLGMLVAVTAERALSDHEHASDPDSMEDRTEWANLLRYLADAFGPLHAGTVTTGDTGSAA
jgi:hypothetical protein